MSKPITTETLRLRITATVRNLERQLDALEGLKRTEPFNPTLYWKTAQRLSAVSGRLWREIGFREKLAPSPTEYRHPGEK